jgi:hypothetical protein
MRTALRKPDERGSTAMETNHPRPRRIPAAPRFPLLAASLAAAAVIGLGSACTVQDAQCSSGEYPVASVGSSSGGACVKNGEDPPKGYVRYPEGKVPEHVDDKWDTYWQNHTLDADGREMP